MNIYAQRYNFIIWQFFIHVFLFCIMLLFDINGSLVFMSLLSLWFIVSYAWLFSVELKYSPDFNPFLILILASIQFVGINGLSVTSEIISGEILHFGIYPVNDYIFKGLFFVSLQHLLMYIGFSFYEYRYKSRDKETLLIDKIATSDLDYYTLGLCLYGTVWILRGIGVFTPLKNFGSIIVNFSTMGQLIVLLFLCFADIRGDRRAMKLHWLIVTIEILLVLGGGMKEMIIRNIIPYCIYLLLRYKSGNLLFDGRLILKLAGIFIFILFVFSYISVFRDIANRRQMEWKNVSIAESFSEYADYLQNTGIYAEISKKEDKGVSYLMSRAGSIGCNAWSINYAQTNGEKPQYLYFCSVGLIPRILWPNKPDLKVGAMMYRLSTGHETSWNKPIEENLCSVSLGFIGSCYFSLGLLGALTIPVFMGLFCDFFWNFLKKRLHRNVLAVWAAFTLFSLFLKDCESLQDAGLIFTAWSCVYMLLVKYVFITKAE